MIQVVHQIRIRILIFYPSRIQGSKRHRIPDPNPQHWHWRALKAPVTDTFCCCVAGSWWRRLSRWRRPASSPLRGTQRLPTCSPQHLPRRARAWSVYKTLFFSPVPHGIRYLGARLADPHHFNADPDPALHSDAYPHPSASGSGLALKNPPKKTQKTHLKNPQKMFFVGFLGLF